MKRKRPKLGTIVLLLVGVFLIWQIFSAVLCGSGQQEQAPTDVSFSEFRAAVESNRVDKGAIDNYDVGIGFDKNIFVIKYESGGETFKTAELREAYPGTKAFLDEHTIRYLSPKEKTSGVWEMILGALVSFLPMLLLLVLLFWVLGRAAGGQAKSALQFGKARFSAEKPTTKFIDVAGCDEAKEELQEVVEFLRNPAGFLALGARSPRGVLLVGPPGCGKTLLARAVAGEADVQFFSISGSGFVEMFVGVGASRVRDLFDAAKKVAPAIIFIDELDAVGRHRGSGLGGSHDEREQTLNQILIEMDGFERTANIVVLAATNRPDILDPALLRPGRFDRRVVLDLPDAKARQAILDVHMRGKSAGKDVSLKDIARQTTGFSGADLENVTNEAAILAHRQGKETIAMSDLMEAIDRVIAGPERKSRVLSHKERELVAYHEAGHALVASRLEHADPIVKITIIPRGLAGGFTRLEGEDRFVLTEDYLKAQLAVDFGGRAAEKLVLGVVSTGPHNDLEKATGTAKNMVMRFGMSKKLGPRILGREEGPIFLGKELIEQSDYSEATAEDIDSEIRMLLDEAEAEAERILTGERATLDAIANKLLEVETLEGEALKEILKAS